MDADKTPELIAEIRKCQPSVRKYIKQLETENAKLCKTNAALQAKNLTNVNRTKSLAKELAKTTPQPVDDKGAYINKTIHRIVVAHGGWDKFCETNKGDINAEYPEDEPEYEHS